MEKLIIRKSALLRSLVVTLLSFVILNISFNGVSILSLFSPLEGQADFQLSDLYTKVADKRPVSQCSDRVVVVSTDNCSREDIVTIVDVVRSFSPAAIGVDINFRYPTDDDFHMLSVFSECDNIVLPLVVSSESDENSFLTDFLPAEKFSAVNMERFSKWGPVRFFRPYFMTEDGIVSAFSVRLASLADESKTNDFLDRGNEREFINYHSRTFEVLSCDDIFDEDASERLVGKVVLFGDMMNSKDVFPAPHNESIPGVMIHAYCVDTILNGTPIDSMSLWLNIVISVILCFLFSLLHIVLERYFDDGVDFIVRLIQISMMFFLYWLGCMLFVHRYFYVDMSVVLLMIVISAFSTDVYAGVEKICVYLKNRFKK